MKVKDVIEAGRKNGLKWLRDGNYYNKDTGSACWIGQAAINLSVYDIDLDRALLRLFEKEHPEPFKSMGSDYGWGRNYGARAWITDYNDFKAESYDDVTRYVEELFAGLEDEEIAIPTTNP